MEKLKRYNIINESFFDENEDELEKNITVDDSEKHIQTEEEYIKSIAEKYQYILVIVSNIDISDRTDIKEFAREVKKRISIYSYFFKQSDFILNMNPIVVSLHNILYCNKSITEEGITIYYMNRCDNLRSVQINILCNLKFTKPDEIISLCKLMYVKIPNKFGTGTANFRISRPDSKLYVDMTEHAFGLSYLNCKWEKYNIDVVNFVDYCGYPGMYGDFMKLLSEKNNDYLSVYNDIKKDMSVIEYTNIHNDFTEFPKFNAIMIRYPGSGAQWNGYTSDTPVFDFNNCICWDDNSDEIFGSTDVARYIKKVVETEKRGYQLIVSDYQGFIYAEWLFDGTFVYNGCEFLASICCYQYESYSDRFIQQAIAFDMLIKARYRQTLRSCLYLYQGLMDGPKRNLQEESKIIEQEYKKLYLLDQ